MRRAISDSGIDELTTICCGCLALWVLKGALLLVFIAAVVKLLQAMGVL